MGGEFGRNQLKIMMLWWEGSPGNEFCYCLKGRTCRGKWEKALPRNRFWRSLGAFCRLHGSTLRRENVLTESKKNVAQKTNQLLLLYPHPLTIATSILQATQSCPFHQTFANPRSKQNLAYFSSARLWHIFHSFISSHFLDLDLISELLIHSALALCLLSINQHWSPSSYYSFN